MRPMSFIGSMGICSEMFHWRHRLIGSGRCVVVWRNQRWLILGASGGIGEALGEQMARKGARLLLASRSPTPCRAEGFTYVRIDLASEDVEAQMADICQRYPDIDGVIHCAGQGLFAAVEQTPLQELERLWRVNLRSAYAVARCFSSYFRQRGHGELVFIGSTFGSIGFPGYSAYCATKFALRGLTEALRREWADSGIAVRYIAPRATKTGMNSPAVVAMNRALGNRSDSPEAVAFAIVRTIERKRGRRYLGWPERLFVAVNNLIPAVVDTALRRKLSIIQSYLKSEY
ncbi:SDR family oxidoreductase [Marinimicrobium sp. LS-A18]|uniref:SDR family oxidoreductase n=1 Tax=Marinimicrobium sp. LS-A18 TaxID=1381596 RepID=UPI00350FE89F